MGQEEFTEEEKQNAVQRIEPKVIVIGEGHPLSGMMAGIEAQEIVSNIEPAVIPIGRYEEAYVYRRQKFGGALMAMLAIAGASPYGGFGFDSTLTPRRRINLPPDRIRHTKCMLPECNASPGSDLYCSGRHARMHKILLAKENKERQKLIKENRHVKEGKGNKQDGKASKTIQKNHGRKPTGSPNWKNNKRRGQSNPNTLHEGKGSSKRSHRINNDA